MDLSYLYTGDPDKDGSVDPTYLFTFKLKNLIEERLMSTASVLYDWYRDRRFWSCITFKASFLNNSNSGRLDH
jgi:hypothetical protein